MGLSRERANLIRFKQSTMGLSLHLTAECAVLQSANVLLKSTTTDPRGFLCKLADFGLSRVLDMDATHISTKTYGTISYMPAELLSQGKLTRSADVYSFAMLSECAAACSSSQHCSAHGVHNAISVSCCMLTHALSSVAPSLSALGLVS